MVRILFRLRTGSLPKHEGHDGEKGGTKKQRRRRRSNNGKCGGTTTTEDEERDHTDHDPDPDTSTSTVPSRHPGATNSTLITGRSSDDGGRVGTAGGCGAIRYVATNFYPIMYRPRISLAISCEGGAAAAREE